MPHDLTPVSRQFRIAGEFIDAAPYGTGHINDTYVVRFRTPGGTVRYIFQRINHSIFKDVPRLMENIGRVTAHVRGKLAGAPGSNPDREALTVIPTRDNAAFHQDADGNYWRAYIFIEGARTYDIVESAGQAYEAAKAFGGFQKQLMDLAGPRLHETIPEFHHTPKRFVRLEQAIAADVKNRAAKVKAEIEFALARKAMTGTLIELFERGELPERVTHNDTKINNVMLDDQTGRGVCVIDLDTVMPGLVLYDFGDQIRTTTFTGAEDEEDLRKVQFKLDMFEALVRGYLDAAREFLTPREVEFLAFSGRLITFEIGIRFLTDYLDGDVYFKTHKPDHNLYRARVQFERVRLIEAQQDATARLVAKYR
jgi:Ser/Thr protein kinase RdoA (MazF antagonist)